MIENNRYTAPNINLLSSLVDFAIFYLLAFYLNLNFWVALILSGVVGYLLRRGWLKANGMPAGTRRGAFFLLAGPWWWAVAGSVVLVITAFIVLQPTHFAPVGLIFGELLVAVVLGYIAWIEWVYKYKIRALLSCIACIGWVFFVLDMIMFGYSQSNNAIERLAHLENATAIALFSVLGFTLLVFLWYLIDTFRHVDTMRSLNIWDASESAKPVPSESDVALEKLSSKYETEREDAAKKLGKLDQSSERIIKALIRATSDEYVSVKRAASEALKTPAHQAFLQEHPELKNRSG